MKRPQGVKLDAFTCRSSGVSRILLGPNAEVPGQYVKLGSINSADLKHRFK